MRARVALRALALATLVAVVAACAAGPAPIRYGEESCAFCRMSVSDPRFGAHLVTAKGRTNAFDSIECLASFQLAGDPGEPAPRTILVADYAHPATMIPVGDALFVRDARLHSPMGMGLAAFESAADARAVAGEDAALLSWADVLELVRAAGTTHGHAPGAAAGHDHGGTSR